MDGEKRKMNIKAKQPENISPLTRSVNKRARFWQFIIGHKKAYLIVSLALLIAIGVSSFGVHSIQPSYAFSSKCTLNIINGSVDITVPGNIETQPGINGMTLDVGDRVKTSPDSAALLTFFDGSTLTLQPNTDIEIEQLELDANQQTITIVLKQWTGNTWSHVVKMADLGSHYEIKTPSAVALVRGTQFLVEVDEIGATIVSTAEGLVSVSAQGTEIFLPVGQQTNVEPGTSPSDPTSIDISEYVKAQEKLLNGALHSQSNSFKDSINDNPDFNNKQKNSNDKQSQVTVKDSGSGKNNSIGNAGNQAVKSNQSQNNSQDNGNNNGNANGQNEDNGNNNGNANGQNEDNGNDNGNANGRNEDNGNNQNENDDNGRDKTVIPPTPTPTPPGKSDKDKPDKDI